MRFTRLFTVCSLLFFVVAVALSAPPPPPSTYKSPALQVRVVGSHESPMPGITVALMSESPSPLILMRATDASGIALFEGLPSSREFSIHINQERYKPFVRDHLKFGGVTLMYHICQLQRESPVQFIPNAAPRPPIDHHASLKRKHHETVIQPGLPGGTSFVAP